MSQSKKDKPEEGLDILKSPPFKVLVTDILIKDNYSRKTIKFECIIDYTSYRDGEFDGIYNFLMDSYKKSEKEGISANITFERSSFLNLTDEHNVRFREPNQSPR